MIGIAGRHIGLGLVVIVIGNEILHRVFREELPHLPVELGGQSLVGGQDEGRALHLLDQVCNREGLARAGDAEQGHARLAVVHAFHETANSLGLVPGGGEAGL